MNFSILCKYFIALSFLNKTLAYSLQCPQHCYCTEQMVNCSYIEFTAIPQNLPDNVAIIDFSFNLLNRISPNVFNNQQNLSILHLNRNKIKEINSNSFKGLDNLRVLNLCYNHLMFITDNETFCSLPQLQELYLCYNSLASVPDICFVSHLRVLDLSTNILPNEVKFSISYRKLRSLTLLKLSENILRNLTTTSFEYLHVNSVTQFECVHCAFSQLPSDLFQLFSNLKFLNLSQNSFKKYGFESLIHSLRNSSNLIVLNMTNVIEEYDLTTNIFQPLANIALEQLILLQPSTHIKNNAFNYLNHLTYLDLSYGYIKDYDDDAFSGLPQLKYLLLSDCRLTNTPQNLPKLLTHLNLSNNFIRDGDKLGFKNLKLIEEIDMSGCLFKSINFYNFFELDKLRFINLARNKISTATSDAYLYELRGLRDLNLDGNALVKIDWYKAVNPFKCMQNLVRLSLRDNNCEYIGAKVLNHLKNLQILHLDSNKLQNTINTPDIFTELEMLREISLQNNEIRFLSPYIFSKQVNLILLDLRNNLISSWEPTLFMPLVSLRVLLLSNNRLSLINESSVQFWSKEMNFDLSENPFNCWCDLKWFINWFQQKTLIVKFNNSNRYVCSAPSVYEGHLVSSIDTKEIYNSCLLLPWKIIVISVATGASLLIGLSMGIMYRYQWYIKLFIYRCIHRSKISKNLDGIEWYNVFISHGFTEEDLEWAHQLADYIDAQQEGRLELHNIPMHELYVESTPLLQQSPTVNTFVGDFSSYQWKTYCYERDCGADENYLEKFSQVIKTVRYVIIGLSTDYLENRKCQFELSQLKYEMMTRYGREIKHRIILTTLNNSGQLLHKIPKELNFYTNTLRETINWVSGDNTNNTLFLKQVFDQLIYISRTKRK